MKNRVEKYIEITQYGVSASGKTKIFSVFNTRTRECCGLISWYGGFRKYVFYPSNDFRFDSDCLKMIAGKLEELNKKHRQTKAQIA